MVGHVQRRLSFEERLSSHFPSERSLSRERLPARRFSTLISSSRSGQWMPPPQPTSFQKFRSRAVPYCRRGYHAIGAEIDRPSSSSTVRRVFRLEKVTETTPGDEVSRIEVVIPCISQQGQVVGDDRLDPIQFLLSE